MPEVKAAMIANSGLLLLFLTVLLLQLIEAYPLWFIFIAMPFENRKQTVHPVHLYCYPAPCKANQHKTSSRPVPRSTCHSPICLRFVWVNETDSHLTRSEGLIPPNTAIRLLLVKHQVRVTMNGGGGIVYQITAWRFLRLLRSCLWLCLVISQYSAYCEILQMSNMEMLFAPHDLVNGSCSRFTLCVWRQSSHPCPFLQHRLWWSWTAVIPSCYWLLSS